MSNQTQAKGVWVVRIWHRHGHDIRVADDAISAKEELLAYAKEFWHETFGTGFHSEDWPEGDCDKPIKAYFDERDDEGYKIYDDCPINGRPAPNRWAIFDFDDKTMIQRVYDNYDECVNDADQLDNGCIIPMHV
jgi:hypothetical protein